MNIRVATVNDLKAIQDLNHELFLHDNQFKGDLNLNWPYEPDGEAYFRGAIENTHEVAMVAEQNDSIIGYFTGHIIPKHSAYHGKRAELDTMCVSETMRGKGVGRLLVDAFKAWAAEQGAERLIVEAFSDNTAVEFYKKCGFEPYALKLSLEL